MQLTSDSCSRLYPDRRAAGRGPNTSAAMATVGGVVVVAAVGGRSMAHAVQQGSRRVLAALEASGLAAPPMESPNSASSRPSTRRSRM